jgi:hypothetical protein
MRSRRRKVRGACSGRQRGRAVQRQWGQAGGPRAVTRSPWRACGRWCDAAGQSTGRRLRARGRGQGRVSGCVNDRTPIDGWVTWDGGHSNLMLQPGNDPSVRYASVDDGPSSVRGRPRRWGARKGDEFLKGWWLLWLLRWATAPVFGRPVQRVGGQLRCSGAP